MKVKINGKDIEDRRIEMKDECSDAAGWMVIIIGALACVGWWYIWR